MAAWLRECGGDDGSGESSCSSLDQSRCGPTSTHHGMACNIQRTCGAQRGRMWCDARRSISPFDRTSRPRTGCKQHTLVMQRSLLIHASCASSRRGGGAVARLARLQLHRDDVAARHRTHHLRGGCRLGIPHAERRDMGAPSGPQRQILSSGWIVPALLVGRLHRKPGNARAVGLPVCTERRRAARPGQRRRILRESEIFSAAAVSSQRRPQLVCSDRHCCGAGADEGRRAGAAVQHSCAR